MTALQDQINTDLRDYNTDGDPGSGDYTPEIPDLRDILLILAVGSQFVTPIYNFLNAADAAAARTAVALGSGDSPTFTALTLTGNLTVDTNTFFVDTTNNRVAIGTATPISDFQVDVDADFNGGAEFAGDVAVDGDFSVDTTTLYVDSANDRVGIGTNSPVYNLDVSGTARVATTDNSNPALRILQGGTAAALLVEDVNTDGTPFLIDGSGNVVSGYTATVAMSNTAGSITPQWQLHGYSGTAALSVARWSLDASGPVVLLEKSRGSGPASRGGVSINDVLGVIAWGGDDGSAGRRAAELSVEVDATPGSSDMPGRYVFKLTPDGSATPAEVMRVDRTGFLSFLGDTDTGLYRPGANELAIYSGGAENVRFDENGRAVFGHTDGIASWSGTPKLQVVGTSNANAAVLLTRMTDDALPAYLNMQKGRGTPSSVTASVSGDGLGAMTFSGYDGSAYIRGVQVAAEVDGTVSSSTVPGRYRIYTATTGGTLTEAFRLDSGQKPYFPGHGTTVSSANAVLLSSGSPVGELLRSTSSARYKTAIRTLDPADADFIMDFRPVTYRSKSASDDPNRVHLGFIAEEVAEIDPRLASYIELGGETVPDGVQYERVTVLLVAAVQKLAARVAQLETAT